MTAARDGRGHLRAVGQAPPHDLDAEEAVLGAMLLSNTAITDALEHLTAADFYKPAHATICEAILRLAANNQPADPVTVADQIRTMGADIGDPAALVTLQINTPSTAGAAHYAAIVHRHATDRRRMHILAEYNQAIAAGDTDAQHTWAAALDNLDHDTHRTGLTPDDIGALMRHPEPQITPELLARDDGQHLLVAGSVTLIHGEPSAGKSWVATEAIRQTIQTGQHAVVLDYEGSPRTMAARLIDLDVHPDLADQHLTYLRPGDATPAAVARLTIAANPALVILDGLARAVAAQGLDENLTKDILAILAGLCRPIADHGAAVVVIDHVTKDKENRGRWGRGSSAKLAEADAAYTLELTEPFARGKAGHSTLRIAKDRWGAIGPEGDIAAVVHYEPVGDTGLTVTLQPDNPADHYHGPTRCMDAIYDVLEARPGDELNATQLIAVMRATGNSFRESTVREAAEQLAADPTIPIVGHRGPRGARIYRYDPAAATLPIQPQEAF